MPATTERVLTRETYLQIRPVRETGAVVLGLVGGLGLIMALFLLGFGHRLRGGYWLGGSVSLVLLAWWLFRTAHPRLRVALTESALELRPDNLAQAARQWPLSSISSHSLLLLNDSHSVQIKLFRADGQKLVLRDARKPHAPEAADYRPLYEFYEELTERLSVTKPAISARPNFYQSFWGHLVAGAVVLLAVGGGIYTYFYPDRLSSYLTILSGGAGYLAYYRRNNP